VNSVSEEYRPDISVKKKKVMAITAQKEHIHITCQGCRLEQVERFKYLGAIFTDRGDSNEEIRTRLGMARSQSINVDHRRTDRRTDTTRWQYRPDGNKKAQLTQRERATAVHV